MNHLARRGRLERGGELYGKAFENWVMHELVAWLAYRESSAPLRHWRLPSGIEVDFIVGDLDVAIEAKASARVTSDHLKGLRSLSVEHPRLGRRIVVCLEPRRRKTEDGIEIFPARAFAAALAEGEIV